MAELLDRQDQEKLVDLIKSSGLCSSSSSRRTFLIQIELKPEHNNVEITEHDFIVDLIYRLVQSRNTEILWSILKLLSSSPCNHQKLRYLEAILGLGNYTPSQPKARPAYFVDNRVFRLMPLDIGTIWGLQRSSFIGILAGFEQDEIYETLRNVELVLSKAVKANGLTTEPPTREWIQLDLSKSYGIPDKKSKLLDVAVNFSSEAANSLKVNDFPPLSIPGFLFKINYQEINKYLHKIQDWCEALNSQLFPNESVAIVIDITYSSDENIPQSVQDITHSLQDIESQLRKVCGQKIPIELMHLDYRRFFEHKNESYLEPESNNFSIRDLKPGFLFCRWIDQELIKCGYSQKDLDKDIIQLYEQLKNQYSEEELQECCGSITAIDVVLDIKAITSEEKVTKLYEKLLRFILKYKSKCIHEWVRDYVKSEVLEAVRAALVVISEADLLSDTLMYVWVNAIDFDKFDFNLFCQDGILNPDFHQTKNLKLENLTLALFRKYNDQPDSSLKALINKLVVSYPTLQDFNNFCQNTKEQEDSFLCKNDAKQFEFALRANIKLEKAIEKFKAAPVSYVPTAICWLLAASPPTKSSISEILLLHPKKRAIFGLCTPQEWQKIKKRQDKERQVLDCRRKRPLIYSYSL
ncbi:MAG: hypothetical protein F6K46_19540 [Moorea sp. SIO3E8]|nr:hypothetical protein [Moorena sp. SIO3E8]